MAAATGLLVEAQNSGLSATTFEVDGDGIELEFIESEPPL
jgi:hypothetical protein